MDFSTEFFQAKNEWTDIPKLLKEYNMSSKNTLPGETDLGNKKGLETFLNKQKLRESITSMSALKKKKC